MVRSRPRALSSELCPAQMGINTRKWTWSIVVRAGGALRFDGANWRRAESVPPGRNLFCRRSPLRAVALWTWPFGNPLPLQGSCARSSLTSQSEVPIPNEALESDKGPRLFSPHVPRVQMTTMASTMPQGVPNSALIAHAWTATSTAQPASVRQRDDAAWTIARVRLSCAAKQAWQVQIFTSHHPVATWQGNARLILVGIRIDPRTRL